MKVYPTPYPRLIRLPYSHSEVKEKKLVNGQRYPGITWCEPLKAWTQEAENVEGKMHPLDGLYDYQAKAAQEWYRDSYKLWWWPVGVGKTHTSLEALLRMDFRLPALVVCPPIMLPTWKAACKTRGIAIGNLKNPEDPLAPINLTTYDSCPVREGYGTIIWDEIHYLSHPKTKRWERHFYLSELNPGAYKLGLSGTPVSTSLTNLWAQLQIIAPWRWGTYWQWVMYYHHCTEDGFEGALRIHGLKSDPEIRADFQERIANVTNLVTPAEYEHLLPPATWSLQWAY